MELFLDRGNPLHWIAVLALAASGVLCAWIGIRDGFLRQSMKTNSGVFTGRKAMAAGALYVATALVGLVGAVAFASGGR